MLKNLGNTYDLAYVFEGISQLFDKQNEMDSAVYYSQRALDIFKEMEISYDIVFESTLLSSYLVKMKRWDEAEKLLNECLPISARKLASR